MRILLAAFVFFLSSNSFAALGCELHDPVSITNLSDELRPELNNKIEGLFRQHAKGKYEVVPTYEKVEETVLLSLPDANPRYIWEKFIHLKCLQIDASDENDILKWQHYSDLLIIVSDHTPLVISNTSGAVEWQAAGCE